MKFTNLIPFTATVLLVACASTLPVPAGMTAGKFVPFSCEGGKTFQARASDDGSSVRIRFEGGYELDNKGAGVYEGEGFKLMTAGPVELFHNGKLALKGCKAS